MIVRMFKPQFAPLVESGQKLQTVRLEPKKGRPKVGDDISLREWSGAPYRSKQRELRRSVVTKLERILITTTSILKAGTPLLGDEQDAFARADGFTGIVEMRGWFEQVHKLPFAGIVITWK